MDKTLQNYKVFSSVVYPYNLTNRLDLDNYLLSPYFHLRLYETKYEKSVKDVVLSKGVYFVTFRLLNNSDKSTLI